MARQASSKPADSSANLGFEADFFPFGLRHSDFVISPWVQHFIHHLAPQGNRLPSRTLATLRDTLLPKLLSGELSVASSANWEGEADR